MTPKTLTLRYDNAVVEVQYRRSFLNCIESMTQALAQLEDALIECSPMDADCFIIQRNIDTLDRSLILARNVQEKRMKEITDALALHERKQ